MKILFKNTTKYDKENCDNFINFHANKYGKKELLKYLLMFIVFVYMLIFNIIYKNWYFILALIVIVILAYFINRKKETKKQKKKKRVQEYTFYFYERYIKIRYRRQFDRILYLQIKKIFETDENFFLYTDDKHSLILDKDGFTIGNSKQFSKFIKKKCPFKYNNENK